MLLASFCLSLCFCLIQGRNTIIHQITKQHVCQLIYNNNKKKKMKGKEMSRTTVIKTMKYRIFVSLCFYKATVVQNLCLNNTILVLSCLVTWTVTCFLSLWSDFFFFSQDRNEIQVFLSVQWSEDVQPQSYKKELQKILLTWTNKLRGEYTILNVSEDGSAVIKIKPAAGAVWLF